MAVKKDYQDGLVGRPTNDQRMERAIKSMPKLTHQDLRKAALFLMDKHDLNPLEELIKMANDSETSATARKEILKFLVPYLFPTLKSVDVQQETKMNVTVSVQSYRGASQKDVLPAEMVDSSEYDEFETEDDIDLVDEVNKEEEVEDGAE